MHRKTKNAKKPLGASEDFTDTSVSDSDTLAMQVFITPEENIKLEVGRFVCQDDDGNDLPEKAAMENTLTLLRKAMFTLAAEYNKKYRAELDGDDPVYEGVLQ